MKFKLGVCLLLFSMAVIAKTTQSHVIKTENNDVQSQEEVITNALTYINDAWSDKGKTLSRDMTEKYFDPNTTLIINGKKVYAGYDQFEAHFREVGKHISGKIRFPFLDVMSVDNKLIVRFDEDIYDHKGTYHPTTVMAVFTLHENRIQQWDEVVSSKYFCEAEAASVVYSK